MGRAKQDAAHPSAGKVWAPILIVSGVALTLLVLLIVCGKYLAGGNSAASPVLLTDGSAYRMYELRNDDVLLSYTIKLQNGSGRDLDSVTLRAVLPADAKSGFLRSEDASVRLQNGEETLSLADGETRSFDIIVTAQYMKYGKTDRPSGALPQFYVVYPDGSEGVIENQ